MDFGLGEGSVTKKWVMVLFAPGRSLDFGLSEGFLTNRRLFYNRTPALC